MITIDNSQKLTVESKPIIEIKRNLSIRGMIHLDVPYKIVCDLTHITPEKHSIIIQTLMTR